MLKPVYSFRDVQMMILPPNRLVEMRLDFKGKFCCHGGSVAGCCAGGICLM